MPDELPLTLVLIVFVPLLESVKSILSSMNGGASNRIPEAVFNVLSDDFIVPILGPFPHETPSI